jgi:hypothetical protein
VENNHRKQCFLHRHWKLHLMLWQARYGLILGRAAIDAESLSSPVNTVSPVISGTAQVGSTLTATTGTWTGSPTPTYSYQWKRGGVNIGSATASTYLLITADLAAIITVTVTATNTVGSANATSAGVGPIAAAPATVRSAMLANATVINTSTTPRDAYVNGVMVNSR